MDYLLASSLFGDDAGLFQFFQVMRDCGLGDGRQTPEVVHATVAVAQGLDDQHPGRVGKSFQNLSSGFGLFGVHKNKHIAICIYVKGEIQGRAVRAKL